MDLKSVKKSVLEPQQCQTFLDKLEIEEAFRLPVWVYKYSDTNRNWHLSIATHGEPGSHKFSLGGFRIAPEARASRPGYSNDEEAIGLATGMEEKVYWSRRIKVGGPFGLKNVAKICGGKCVFLPTADARVGQARDAEALDFAIACLKDFEESAGVYLTTGQDLGHGIMADGKTLSIQYMYERFHGNVLADTSKPTAEGNFYLLRGGLAGLGMKLEGAQIGMIGCGNIGFYLLEKLHKCGAKIFALEPSESRREAIEAIGIPTWDPQDKSEFLKLPLDALVINANGGTLDAAAVTQIIDNQAIEFICGSENLALTAPHGAAKLLEARKIFCPTELCGMMGYLTAVEEYFSRQARQTFKIEDMFTPAQKLEEAGHQATEAILKSKFALGFEQAIRKIYV